MLMENIKNEWTRMETLRVRVLGKTIKNERINGIEIWARPTSTEPQGGLGL